MKQAAQIRIESYSIMRSIVDQGACQETCMSGNWGSSYDAKEVVTETRRDGNE